MNMPAAPACTGYSNSDPRLESARMVTRKVRLSIVSLPSHVVLSVMVRLPIEFTRSQKLAEITPPIESSECVASRTNRPYRCGFAASSSAVAQGQIANKVWLRGEGGELAVEVANVEYPLPQDVLELVLQALSCNGWPGVVSENSVDNACAAVTAAAVTAATTTTTVITAVLNVVHFASKLHVRHLQQQNRVGLQAARPQRCFCRWYFFVLSLLSLSVRRLVLRSASAGCRCHARTQHQHNDPRIMTH